MDIRAKQKGGTQMLGGMIERVEARSVLSGQGEKHHIVLTTLLAVRTMRFSMPALCRRKGEADGGEMQEGSGKARLVPDWMLGFTCRMSGSL